MFILWHVKPKVFSERNKSDSLPWRATSSSTSCFILPCTTSHNGVSNSCAPSFAASCWWASAQKQRDPAGFQVKSQVVTMSSNFHADRAMPKKKMSSTRKFFGKGPGPAGFPSSIHSSWHSYRLLPPFEMHPGRFQSRSTGSSRITSPREGAVSEGPVHERNKQAMKSCSYETGQTCFYTQYHSPMYHADTLHCRQFGCFFLCLHLPSPPNLCSQDGNHTNVVLDPFHPLLKHWKSALNWRVLWLTLKVGAWDA